MLASIAHIVFRGPVGSLSKSNVCMWRYSSNSCASEMACVLAGLSHLLSLCLLQSLPSPKTFQMLREIGDTTLTHWPPDLDLVQ